MKKSIIFICPSFIMYSCSNSIGQQPSEEMKKNQEFENLMKRVKETRMNNQKIMSDVDKKTTEVVQKTSETISTLKEENKQLKKELNESGKKIYPTYDTLSNFNFTLRPVSNGEEDR